MYAALWRLMPGNRLVRSLELFVLALAVVAVLFLVVFPLVTPLLPFENVTVTAPTSTPSTSASSTFTSIPTSTPTGSATR